MSIALEWTIVIVIIAVAIAFFIGRFFRRRNKSCCGCPLRDNCRKK